MSQFLRKLAQIPDPWNRVKLPFTEDSLVSPYVVVPEEIVFLVKTLQYFASFSGEEKETFRHREQSLFADEELIRILQEVSKVECPFIGADQYSVLSLDIPDIQSIPNPQFPENISFQIDQDIKAESALNSLLLLFQINHGFISKSTSIDEIIQDQISRFEKGSEQQKAAQIIEARAALTIEPSGPTFYNFLSKCIQRQKFLAISSANVESSQKLVEMDHLLTVFSEKLRQRENSAVTRLRVGRIREILESLSTRIRYFKGQLKVRYEKMKKYNCTGLTQFHADFLVCRRCVLLTSKQKEALDVAINDCVRVFELTRPSSEVLVDLPFPLTEKQKSTFQITSEFVTRELIDCLLYSSYDSVYIFCSRDEAILQENSASFKNLQMTLHHLKSFWKGIALKPQENE